MAFSSYQRSRLSKVEPPEEEEEDNMRPMPRSGSVRAFSHLQEQEAPPQPQEVLRRSSGIHPYNAMSAPDHALPFQAMDEDSADSYSPASRYAEEPPSDDEAPEGDAPSFHAPQNLAPSLVQDAPTARQTSGLMLRPRPMPPEYARQQARGSMANSIPYGSKPATTDADAPPETQHLDTPTDQRGFPQDNRPLETTPKATQQRGFSSNVPSSQQRLQQSQRDTAALQQQVRASNPPTQEGKPATPPQAPAQAPRPTTIPKQNTKSGPQPQAAGGGNQNQPPQFTVNEADENAELTDKTTGQRRKFGEHTRSIINEELDGSPTAVNLLQKAYELSGKKVVIKKISSGEAFNQIGPDGTITVFVNPDTLKPGTLAHEISHSIQNWMYLQRMRGPTGADAKTMKADKTAGRQALHKIVPVMDEGDDLDDSKENEAMRAGNIVKAEVSAAKVKAQLEAIKKSDPKHWEELIKNPEEIAKMFWLEQFGKEGRKHQYNKAEIPYGTLYGSYDFKHILETLGNGVTIEHLQRRTPKRHPMQ